MNKMLTVRKWNGREYAEECTLRDIAPEDATSEAITAWLWDFLVSVHTPAVEGVDDMGDRSDWIVTVSDDAPMIIDEDYEPTEPITFQI